MLNVRALYSNKFIMAVASLLATSCASLPAVEHSTHIQENYYQFEYRAYDQDLPREQSMVDNLAKCTKQPPVQISEVTYLAQTSFNRENPLSHGDMIEVTIDGDDFYSGDYIVDAQGAINLKFLAPLPAANFTPNQFSQSLGQALMAADHYQTLPRISVRVKDLGAVRVHVTGAVFQAGPATLNIRKSEDLNEKRMRTVGDYADGRRLSTAIQFAAGVRPDADIKRIELKRFGVTTIHNLTKLHEGAHADDPLLIAGDEIFVPSTGCFQKDLTSPGPITRAGLKVFISNLTAPAKSNSASSIGLDDREFPYGTRMLEALVGMNCVGGTYHTNARRHATLITHHPVSKETLIVNRNIEQIIRAENRDAFNPVLMPGDALACYDSRITNIRDVTAILTEAISPLTYIGLRR